MRAAVAAFGLFLAANPASAEGLFSPAAETPPSARELGEFELEGAAVFLVARGRRAAPDFEHQRFFEETRAVRGFMPGQPQPAVMTLEFKLWY
jgi:hypothetical protein